MNVLIGDWGFGPIPNPQSPIPNPQSPIPISKKNKQLIYFIYNASKRNLSINIYI